MSDMLQVLYVDDEPDIREIAVMSLSLDPGLDVRTVGSGDEAMALLSGQDYIPDVVLLDAMMPGVDGVTVITHIRSLPWLDATRVIFVTARARDSEQARFISLGAVAVITKPFNPMTLATQVREIAGD